MKMAKGEGRLVDLGCGSSRIIQNLEHSVGLDISLKKLNYIKNKVSNLLVKGSIAKLPFKDEVFSRAICSQVVEHIPKESLDLGEFNRVLKNGGRLIIGTPDYAAFWWRFFEWFYVRILPLAYGEGHIAHYDRKELCSLLEKNGFEILEYKYIMKGELIVHAKKRDVGI